MIRHRIRHPGLGHEAIRPTIRRTAIRQRALRLAGRRSAAVLASLVVCAAAAVASDTAYVDASGVPPGSGTPSDPYTSLEFAIENSSACTFLVAPGEYVGSLDVSAFIDIVATAGPEVTTIVASDPEYAIRGNLNIPFGGTTSIQGFTVTGATSGAGIRAPVHWHLDVTRCIVRGNAIGGLNQYDLFSRQCTYVDNGVGISHEPGAITLLESSMVWDNGTDVADNQGQPNTLFIDYCAGLETAPPGGSNNIVGAPQVWDVAHGDYHLRPGSVCVDAGHPNAPPDPDGSTADIGALTFDPTYAPEPFGYCSGKTNSQGCVPTVWSSGQASASAPQEFRVEASDVVDGKAGLLFYGFGQWAIPFQGGTHCVMAPTRRTTPQLSGGSGACSGSYSFEFNALIQGGVDPSLVAGALVYCQYWYRDAQDPAGFGSGLSNALCFGIAP